jgi:hypothetical protein
MTASFNRPIAPCSLVVIDRLFRCAYSLNHQNDDNDTSIVALMMKAIRSSETSVNFNETTLHYIPEGCDLYALTNSKCWCFGLYN